MGGIVFEDPILAGVVLVRESIQSENYSPGVAGWIINQDGTAEFQDALLRGTLVASSFVTGTSGRRIEINVDDSQSMILYDSNDDPMLYIGDQAGTIASVDPADGTHELDMSQGQLIFLAGTSILTNVATMENDAAGVYLYTQLSGGVAFVKNAGAWAPMVPGSTSGIEAWQIPGTTPGVSYAANWGQSTSFNGTANWAPLQFGRDAQDMGYFYGAFKAGATTPGGTVLNVPVQYRPKKQWPIPIQMHTGATGTTPIYGMAEIGSSGNLNLLSGNGITIAAGNEYLISGSYPLGNAR